MICKGFFVKGIAQPKETDFEKQISEDIINQTINILEKLSRHKAKGQFHNFITEAASLELTKMVYDFQKNTEGLFENSDKKEEALQYTRDDYNKRLEMFSNPASYLSLKEFLTDEEKLKLFEILTTPHPKLD